jgi:hypothetical protein
VVVSTFAFLFGFIIGGIPLVLSMKRKTTLLAVEKDLPVDLTLHNVSASLLAEFAEQIVKPYYHGNLNAAFQDLIHKTLSEQKFVLSHITHIRAKAES